MTTNTTIDSPKLSHNRSTSALSPSPTLATLLTQLLPTSSVTQQPPPTFSPLVTTTTTTTTERLSTNLPEHVARVEMNTVEPVLLTEATTFNFGLEKILKLFPQHHQECFVVIIIHNNDTPREKTAVVN